MPADRRGLLSEARVVVLDSHPLGLASKARGNPDRDACAAWLDAIELAGVLVVAPAIADYEVRRELLRTGARAGIPRLDRLIRGMIYAPITTPAIHWPPHIGPNSGVPGSARPARSPSTRTVSSRPRRRWCAATAT
jgi:hypothetical protein